ncbi:MAG: hypothetical protein M1835_007803 [Candelina submexicana]|nr:MAG: hypothetical protein M1835_007803 [Candelina submexicana]
MFTPTYINLRYWFYPTGNTPAVNLFRELPALTAEDNEDEAIKALLLACGDPRNVLFSLECESNSSRKFDITCCDLEPAVLARNVILFALIADDARPEDIWNIFYHLFLPDSTLKVLHDQVEKLLLASDPPQAWTESLYGTFIRFSNLDTLQQLRKYWILYSETRHFDTSHAQRFERDTRATITQIFNERIKDNTMFHGTRSVGVAWARGCGIMGRAFTAYWKTGVVGGNMADLQALGDSKGHVNPTFAISSAPTGKFAVHYGTDPLLGFNLSDAFDGQYSIDTVVQAAKRRFKSWCNNFSTRLTKSSVLVRLFCGDAIRFCHTLQEGPTSSFGSYLGPWTARSLALGGLDGKEKPLQYFDIIDTSNLIDHVGMLNVLVAAAPLLRQEVSSCLYTECLLQATKDITKSLQALLCSDVTSISLILGLAPVGHLLGMTIDDVSTEAFLYSAFSAARQEEQRQYRMRVPWKYPGLGDPCRETAATALAQQNQLQRKIRIDADQLAGLFFSIYKRMFATEDLSAIMASIGKPKERSMSYDLRYYSRASLVALLRLAMKKVQSDWTRSMDRLIEEVGEDRSLIIGSNSLQELYMYLHVFGIRRCPELDINPREIGLTPNGQPRSTSTEKGLLARRSVPPMVHIVLVVPRKKLEIFTDESPDKIGTPTLHLSIRQIDPQTGFDNRFFSIHCFFGKITDNPSDKGACCAEEDVRGWSGGADLIVTCPVPTLQLLLGPQRGIQVALTINTTPSNTQFIRKLGMALDVFATGLNDTSRLKILERAPGLAGGPHVLSKNNPSQWQSSEEYVQHPVTIQLDKESRSTHLQVRADIVKSSEQGQALATGGVVEVTQTGPCSLRLRIGGVHDSALSFPFPINGVVAKTRIARKSSWIEVSVPVSAALDPSGFVDTFPVIIRKNKPPVAWSIPRIQLDCQPKVQIKKDHDYSWIMPLMTMTRSDRERIELELEPSKRNRNPILDLKESLQVLFISFVGLNNNYGLIDKFQLCMEGTGGHTLIFVTALRHDLDSGSVVLDACVVPLTISRVHSLKAALSRLVEAKPLMINVNKDETILWKKLLPALAERCRTWKHNSTCQYQKRGAPLSIEVAETPLCSCGEGQVSPEFLERKDWAGFRKYATRIAISPIFPVPYVESLVSNLQKGDPKESRMASSAPGASAWDPRIPSASSMLASSMAAYAKERCDFCGASSMDTKLCGRCKGARYCNAECQKSHWKEHKKLCKHE